MRSLTQLLSFIFIALNLSAQQIDVNNDWEPIEIYSLLEDQTFIEPFSDLYITNLSNSDLEISVTLIEEKFPNSWRLESPLFLDEGMFFVPSGEQIIISSFLMISPSDLEDTQGSISVNVSAVDIDQNEIYNGNHDMNFEFMIPPIPIPTFRINTENNPNIISGVVDTILFPIENSFPGFFSYIEIPFEDQWFLERNIYIEPYKNNSLNLQIENCEDGDPYPNEMSEWWCSGNLMKSTNYLFGFEISGQILDEQNYKFEVCATMYDPLDSLNSNYTFCALGIPADCFYPRPAEIISSEYEQYPCINTTETFEANPIYTNLRWENGFTGEINFGNSLTVNYTDQPVSLWITALDLNGCKVEQFLEFYPEEISFEAAILEPIEFSEQCYLFNAKAEDGYSDYQWFIEDQLVGEGQTTNLDLRFLDRQDVFYLRLEAVKDNGCKVLDERFIQVGQGEETNMIEIASGELFCEGDVITLTTSDEYSYHKWEYLGQVYEDKTITITVGNSSIWLTALDEEGCQHNQWYGFNLFDIQGPNLCLVTNDVNAGQNAILWEDPTDMTNITSFIVYREGNIAEQYDPIGEVVVDLENVFVDTQSEPSQRPYRYKVSAKNHCGTESSIDFIDFHKTIHLTANIGINNVVNLSWDDYIGISYAQVKILRGESPSNLTELAVLSANVNSFTDNQPLPNKQYYQIEIADEVNCETGRRIYKVQSNQVELETTSTIELEELDKIYPNPFSNNFYISIDNPAKLSLFNSQGQLVQKAELKAGLNNINVEREHEAGLYLLKIKDPSGERYHQLIKIE